jgi:hypothetical protein
MGQEARAMGRYDYVDKNMKSPIGGWIIEVRKGSAVKGNIRKNPVTGRYQFYRGSRNVIRPALEESDIEALKQGIEKLEL